MSHISVDTRGLSCPQPVIETKKAIASGSVETLEVLVDNATAMSNVTRFATSKGFKLTGSAEQGDGATLLKFAKTF